MDFTTGPSIGAAIPHKSPVTSLSYHGDGVHLFAASEADSRLYLINSQTGKCDQAGIKCEREGIRVVSSTHHDHSVLFAGKGSPGQPAGQRNAVQYLSLYDNKILRKFRGHTDLVTNISMCPGEDMFLTSSRDRTVRLWSVQQAGCLAQMELPSNTEGVPHAVFDSTGLVFAVTATMTGGTGQYIHLYDARNHTAGAFSELQVSRKDLQQAMQTHRVTAPPGSDIMDWKSISFNASGNRMLVESAPGLAVVLDGFEGTVQRVFASASPTKQSSTVFTPDDQSVLMGTDSGIHCWNVQSGSLVKTLEGHTGPVGALTSNPKYAQVASSCSSTCLWIW